MITTSDGASPWWIGKSVSCVCGFRAILERRDRLSAQWLGESTLIGGGRKVAIACPNCEATLSATCGAAENATTGGADGHVLLLEGRK